MFIVVIDLSILFIFDYISFPYFLHYYFFFFGIVNKVFQGAKTPSESGMKRFFAAGLPFSKRIDNMCSMLLIIFYFLILNTT